MAVESKVSLTNSETPGLVDISSSSSWGGWESHKWDRNSLYCSCVRVKIFMYAYTPTHVFTFLPSACRWWKLEEFLAWLCLQKKIKTAMWLFFLMQITVWCLFNCDPWISSKNHRPICGFLQRLCHWQQLNTAHYPQDDERKIEHLLGRNVTWCEVHLAAPC